MTLNSADNRRINECEAVDRELEGETKVLGEILSHKHFLRRKPGPPQ
jgi:hypothetical protein